MNVKYSSLFRLALFLYFVIFNTVSQFPRITSWFNYDIIITTAVTEETVMRTTTAVSPGPPGAAALSYSVKGRQLPPADSEAPGWNDSETKMGPVNMVSRAFWLIILLPFL